MKNVDPMYLDGRYESRNPDWHKHEAAWKADLARGILARNRIEPDSICDIGCGTGGVLRALVAEGHSPARAVGLDVSSRVIEMAKADPVPGVSFAVLDEDFEEGPFDAALVLDVFEHVPDYLGFLAGIRDLAGHFVFHIPLDMNAQSVARPAAILGARESLGHLHYFSRDTALATLDYAGFRVLDWRYTASWETVADRSFARRTFDAIRALLFRLSPARTVDALGGYSLLVLATGTGSGADGSGQESGGAGQEPGGAGQESDGPGQVR